MGRSIDRFVPLRFRAAALMPAAVLAVHQLRFQLAFGERADSRLAAEGHQYLAALAPLAAVLAAIAAGLFLAALTRARRGAGADEAGRASGFVGLSLAAAAALLAIYSAQELAEGFLASGHPGGLAGVFGHGGLWALPLSLLFGALVALALRVADVAVRWVAERAAAVPAPAARAAAAPRPARVFLAPPQPLAALAAGRAPPRPAPLAL